MNIHRYYRHSFFRDLDLDTRFGSVVYADPNWFMFIGLNFFDGFMDDYGKLIITKSAF